MQREPPSRQRAQPVSSASALNFDAPLDREDDVLDAMLAALARNQLAADAWDRLNAAAQRDDHLSELAFAYESASQSKRVKAVPPAVAAEFLYQAARFFHEIFGDDFGATKYAERALDALPAHQAAFEKLELLLTKSKNIKRLAEVYAEVAQHKPRAEHMALLKRAAEALEKLPGSDEKAIEVYQQLLRLDPADDTVRSQLEVLYTKANRIRDVARLLEQGLAQDPPPPQRVSRKLHTRLLDIYARQLHEPERTIPHVESLLELDPSHDEARQVAMKLIVIKGLAARAAAALAQAHAAVGSPQDVARFLQIELEHTRGPKRKDVLLRIGVLKQERLHDPQGAYELFEQALALDPADDELRGRYSLLAGKLNKCLEAAKTLGRVGSTLKDPVSRAEVSADAGQLLFDGGELQKAKAAFLQVLAQEGAGKRAVLTASRALAEIHAAAKDFTALADVLEKAAMLETDPERARVADEQLADLAMALDQMPRAVAAYKRLLGTSSRAKALEALTPILESSGDPKELALILEERSKDALLEEGRMLMFRAAEMLTSQGQDLEAASVAWKSYAERFGFERAANAQWITVLESRKDWAELARVYEGEAGLLSGAERAEVYVRLGNLHLQKVRDVPAAIEAFRHALEADPRDKWARAALDKLAAAGDHRLEAAAVLEPLYRAENAGPALVKILELRAQLAASPEDRLSALAEAVDLAAGRAWAARQSEAPQDHARAVDLVGRGLVEAVAGSQPLGPWLERVERLCGRGTDPMRRATILSKAIGDREVTSKELLLLARHAGDALEAAGDVGAALAIYRRALEFEPSSGELLGRVDELLKGQGSPGERVALYRAALERGGDPVQRRDLLHRIGSLERHDLKDPRAAIMTYMAALKDDPDDGDAFDALAELFAETEAWPNLCALLGARVARATDDEARRLRARLAEAAASHGELELARTQCRALLADPGIGQNELGAVERAAEVMGDFDVARDVYRKRAESAENVDVQIQWLEKLGELESDQQNDLDAAAATWKEAAHLAEGSGDEARARALYTRVRKVAPEDLEAAQRLAELCERAQDWAKLPALYAVLLEHAEDSRARVELLLGIARVLSEHLGNPEEAAAQSARAFEIAPTRKDVLDTFERMSVLGKTTALFERAVDDVLREPARGAEPGHRVALMLAKARVLGADPSRRDDAAATYRAVLEESPEPALREAATMAFEALIAANEDSPARRADRRWLLEWRAEHAEGFERALALSAWALAEEERFGDAKRALELYQRVVELAPEDVDALGAVARLSVSLGDVSGALAALTARRDRTEGPARADLEVEIASILLERTTRFEEVLAGVRAALEIVPQDPQALALAGRLLAQPSTRGPATAMLEEALEGAENPDARAKILERLLDAPAEASLSEARRRWYERLLATLVEEGLHERALETVGRAAAEMPAVTALWDQAEEIARTLKRPDEIGELYLRALNSPAIEKVDALALGERAVAFHEEWFDDPSRVVGILERVLDIDPGAEWAFQRLKLLLDSGERWDELFALYDRVLPATPDDRRTELLEDVAQIAKDFAGRPDRAIGYLEQLLQLKPKDAALSASLERLYEKQGRHRSLITLLEARLPSLSKKEAARTRARIASLWIDELHDAASALNAVEELLTSAPGAAGEDPIDIAALLERVLAEVPTNEDAVPDTVPAEPPPTRSRKRKGSVPPPKQRLPVRQRTAALLRGCYAEAGAGREADLVRILEIELEAIKNRDERVRRHQQIATLHANLGNEPAALEHYVALVMLEPEAETHRVKLAELAERVGRLDRLSEVLAAAAEDSTDDGLRVELLMQAGIVQADRIGDGARAIELFQRLFSLKDAPRSAVLSAARRLDPLLDAAQRAGERLAVLERIASLESDPGARRTALGTAARLATDLGENARAIEAWEARLAEDEEDLDALNGLAGLLDVERQFTKLIAVLGKRARAHVSVEQKRADRVRIAAIQDAELHNADKAIGAWRDVEREFEESDESTLALARLLRETKRWDELEALLARGAERASQPALRAELFRQLGDVQASELGARDRALASYRGALEIDPKSERARAGLAALLGDDGLRPGAVDALMKAYVTTDEFAKILELTPDRLLAASEGPAKLEVLLDSARLAETRAGDLALAFDSIRHAFLLAPGDARVEEELFRLAEASGQWAGLVDAHRAVIATSEPSDAARVAHHRYRMGQVLDVRMNEPAAALEAYITIASSDPASLPPAIAAIAVAGRLSQWESAARVVVGAVHGAPVDDGSRQRALFSAIEEAAVDAKAWDLAAGALSDAVDERQDLADTVARELYAQIAAWHRDRRGDPDAAEAALHKALSHDPTNPGLLSQLAQLQRRAKGRPLVDSLLRLSQATGGDLDLLREAGEAAQASGDRTLAKTILDQLLHLATDRWLGVEKDEGPITMGNPTSPSLVVKWALEELVRIHEEEADFAQAVELLVYVARLPFERDVSREMSHRAAKTTLDKLGQVDRAIALYGALFQEDPADEEAVTALVRLFVEHDRPSELLALRERQIATTKQLERRLALRLEAAQLLVKLGDTRRGVDTLRENLREEPRHSKTVDALVAALEHDDRNRELVELLSEQAKLAEAANEPVHAAEFWARAAEVNDARLGEHDLAIRCHERVVALEPRPSSFDALARLSAARGEHAAAAAHLERLREVSAREERAAVSLRLAEELILAGEPERAVARLEEACADDPSAEAPRQRLAGVYREVSAWRKLAELTRVAADYAPDKAARLERLREAADLFGKKCDAWPEAIPLLEQACDLEPDDRAMRLALADAHRGAGRFDEARALLKNLIEAFGGRRPKDRAPVHFHLARLELAMGNGAGALMELDAATRIDPQNPEILRALAELARDDGQLERAERSYRALLVVLRQKEPPTIARSEVLLELCAIARAQGDEDRAREILESALEVAAKSDLEEERLEQALRAKEEYETLVRALEAKLARQSEGPAVAKTLGELADVYEAHLGRAGDAFPVRLRSLGMDPSSTALHEATLALARRANAVDAYAGALADLVKHATAEKNERLACDLSFRLGAVAENDLKDDARAEHDYERALESDARLPEALRALDRIYERNGNSKAQLRVLAKLVEIEAKGRDPRAASDAFYRLATLKLQSKKTVDEGCGMLKSALELEPQADRALAALAKAIEFDPQNERVLELYEEVARTPGYERALVDVLVRRAELPGSNGETLRDAVEIAKGLGDSALAESLLKRFIDGERSTSQNAANLAWAYETFADLRQAAGDLRQTADLKRSAARFAEPEVARRLLFDVARAATDALDDLVLAAETYQELHKQDAADREVWAPLLDVYRKTGKTDALVLLLASVADMVDDPRERSRLRLERVEVMTRGMGLGDEAAGPLREILDEDPGQVEAAIMLADILERTGGEEELAELLGRQMEAAKDRNDGPSVASLALRLGALLETRNTVEARNVYYAGLDWDASNTQIMRALLRIYEASGENADRADILERLLPLEHGPQAVQMALTLHGLRTDQWDDAAAERALELGFKAHPESVELRDRLESSYREKSDWAKLAELCVVDASARTDVEEKVARLREAAHLHHAELKDPATAAAILRMAMDAKPHDLELFLLRVTMLAESGDRGAAVTELTTWLESLEEDDPRRAELLAQRAPLRSAAGDHDGAVEDLHGAFVMNPPAYAGALATELEAAYATLPADSPDARELRLRLASVLPQAGDMEGARVILGELVRQEPKDKDALTALASLEEASERWDAASAAYRRLVTLEEGDAVVDVALRLADACERANRMADARGGLERARMVAPENELLRQRLERLYEEMGALRELADLYLADAAATGDVAGRFTHLFRAGSVLLQEGGDTEAAIAPLKEALALRPTEAACIALLSDAYVGTGRAAEATELLNNAIAAHKGKRSRELAALYHRLARVALAVGDGEAQLRYLTQALDMDSQNGAAAAELAMVAMDASELELANRALRAVTMQKTAGPMSRALAYQYMGEIARKQGDSKKALMMLKRAIADDPSLEGAKALIDVLQQEGA